MQSIHPKFYIIHFWFPAWLSVTRPVRAEVQQHWRRRHLKAYTAMTAVDYQQWTEWQSRRTQRSTRRTADARQTPYWQNASANTRSQQVKILWNCVERYLPQHTAQLTTLTVPQNAIWLHSIEQYPLICYIGVLIPILNCKEKKKQQLYIHWPWKRSGFQNQNGLRWRYLLK